MVFNFFELFKTLLAGMGIIILVFLVLREFWCWYFKINKRIALLEEQNRLLDSLNQYLIPSVKSDYRSVEIERSIANKDNKPYTITREMKLFDEPDKNSSIICRVLKGETVVFLDKKEIDNITWYKLKDREDSTGWCLLDSSE